jgi:Ran GTPase-activating protein (RanGAP) involved in mRNA processing and transport
MKTKFLMNFPDLEHGLVLKIIEKLESASVLRKVLSVSKTMRMLSRDLIMESIDVTLLVPDCPAEGRWPCFWMFEDPPAVRQVWSLSLWPKISSLPKTLGEQKGHSKLGISQFEQTVSMSDFISSQKELLAFCHDSAIKLNVKLHASDSFWEGACNNDSSAAFISKLSELEIIFQGSTPPATSGIYENSISRACCLKKIEARYPFMEVQNGTCVRRSEYDPITVSVLRDVCCGIRWSTSLEKLLLVLPGLFEEEGAVENLAYCLSWTTRLQDLDLGGNGFGDGLFVMAESFTALERLSALNLSHNRISEDGSLCIAKALSNLSYLTNLDLRNNRLGLRAMRNVCDELKSCRLFTLNRIKCESWFNGNLAQAFCFPYTFRFDAQAEPRQVRPGEVDDWSDGQETANLIGALLPRSASSLTRMVLKRCDNDMLLSLASAIKHLTSLTTLELKCFELSSCHDRDELLVLLADGLKNLVSLQILQFSTFYNDDDKGITAIAPNLRFFTQLHVLDLEGSSMQDLGCTAISKHLACVTSLQTLVLRKNRIGPIGATSICEALKLLTGLKELYMGENPLSSEGGMALAKLLKSLPALEILRIDSADLHDEAVQAIGDSLQRLPCCLEHLIMADNKLTSLVGESLCCTLVSLTALKGLDISFIDMDGATGVALSECLAVLTCLENLQLYSVSLSECCAVALVSTLSRLVKLKELNLGGGTLKCIGSAGLELPTALIPLVQLISLDLSFNSIALNVWRKILELLFGHPALHRVQHINGCQCDQMFHGGLKSFSLNDAFFAQDCLPLLACLLPRSSETLTDLDLSSYGYSMQRNVEAIVECIHPLSALKNLDLLGFSDDEIPLDTWLDCITTLSRSLPSMLRDLTIGVFHLEDMCILLTVLDMCPSLTIINGVNCRAILRDISQSRSFKWTAQEKTYIECRPDRARFSIDQVEEQLLCALLYLHGTALTELQLNELSDKMFSTCLSRLTSICLLHFRSWWNHDIEKLVIGLAALPSLSHLSLLDVGLKADGATVIANALANKISLSTLDLRNNNGLRETDIATVKALLSECEVLF